MGFSRQRGTRQTIATEVTERLTGLSHWAQVHLHQNQEKDKDMYRLLWYSMFYWK